MNRDDAIAVILAKSHLEPQDLLDLEDAAAHEAENPGGVATLMRVYTRYGAKADRTTWQDIAEEITVLEDVGGHLGPLIGILVSIAPLL